MNTTMELPKTSRMGQAAISAAAAPGCAVRDVVAPRLMFADLAYRIPRDIAGTSYEADDLALLNITIEKRPGDDILIVSRSGGVCVVDFACFQAQDARTIQTAGVVLGFVRGGKGGSL